MAAPKTSRGYLCSHFETSTREISDITPQGLLTTRGTAGDVAVMVRYQGQVDVFRGIVPMAASLATTPEPRNFIDEVVFAKLKLFGIPPAAECDDATFVRRTALDIAGRLPTAVEAQAFLADSAADKRDKWIDKLLASSDYGDYFATKWSALLRNQRGNDRQARGTFAFHQWIRESLRENKPYDQFVRELIVATGDMVRNPAVVWYRTVATGNQQLEDTAQLFLGQRIQCARCHHHPYEKWAQADYYGFAAFFARVARKASPELKIRREPGVSQPRQAKLEPAIRGPGRITTPGTGLGGEPLVGFRPDADPRRGGWLIGWLIPRIPTSPARWSTVIGSTSSTAESLSRKTTCASPIRPRIPNCSTDWPQSFIESHFDIKQLVRTICQSRTYQLSLEPNDLNATDTQNFSGTLPQASGGRSVV